MQRLRPPHWRQAPPMARFGELDDLLRASRAARLNASLIAAELGALGIDVDCAPVLDLPVVGAHDVIGDRAFSGDAEVVAALGRAVCDGLLAGESSRSSSTSPVTAERPSTVITGCRSWMRTSPSSVPRISDPLASCATRPGR